VATFADPKAVKLALQKTGSSADWFGAPAAPVDYAPAGAYPPPPDKLPDQPIPQDPDKLPPAAQVTTPPQTTAPQEPAPREGEVTVTVKTPRQPSPQPAPEQAPSSAPAQVTGSVGAVENLPLDLSKSTRALQGDVAATKSRDIELLQEQRDIKDASLTQQQAIESKRAEVGAESLGRQRDTADTTRETGDEYRKQMEAELASMKEKMANPPKDTVGMVFGLISTLAALSGKAQGAAAISGLGQIVNQRMKKWQGEIASNQAGMEGMGKLININELQGKNRETAEAELAKASAVEIISAAEAAKAQAKTADQVVAADLAINEAKRVFSAAELKSRAQAAAARRRAQIYNAIGSAKSAEEQDAIAAANGQVGQDVLRDVRKTQGQTADVAKKTMDVEKTVADIGKTQAEATAAQADATKKLRDAQKGTTDKPMTEGDYKADAIVSGFVPAYQRLQSIVARGDEVNRGATKETWLPDLFRSEQTLQQRADIKALGLGVLRAESGANIPVHEIENKFEALPVNSGDPQVRAQGLRDLLTAAAALDRQGRIQQAASKVRAAQASANGGQEPTVRVIRADGKTLDVPRSRATALIKAAPAGAYKIQD